MTTTPDEKRREYEPEGCPHRKSGWCIDCGRNLRSAILIRDKELEQLRRDLAEAQARVKYLDDALARSELEAMQAPKLRARVAELEKERNSRSCYSTRLHNEQQRADSLEARLAEADGLLREYVRLAPCQAAVPHGECLTYTARAFLARNESTDRVNSHEARNLACNTGESPDPSNGCESPRHQPASDGAETATRSVDKCSACAGTANNWDSDGTGHGHCWKCKGTGLAPAQKGGGK